MSYTSITAEWKVMVLQFITLYSLTVTWNILYHIQSSLSLSLPPVSYYIVYHNVTSDGGHGIIVYDTTMTIIVLNDQFGANAAYAIQVAAVNVIGHGPFREAILCEGFWDFSKVASVYMYVLYSFIDTSTADEETTSSFLASSSNLNIVYLRYLIIVHD